jgi:hypothetical protein
MVLHATLINNHNHNDFEQIAELRYSVYMDAFLNFKKVYIDYHKTKRCYLESRDNESLLSKALIEASKNAEIAKLVCDNKNTNSSKKLTITLPGKTTLSIPKLGHKRKEITNEFEDRGSRNSINYYNACVLRENLAIQMMYVSVSLRQIVKDLNRLAYKMLHMREVMLNAKKRWMSCSSI